MNDTPETSSQQPLTNRASKLTFVLPVLAVIMLVGGIGYWVATRTGMDAKLVESVLTQWSQNLSAYGKAHGQDITFRYDHVEMKGEAAGRYAVVVKPSVEIRQHNEETGTEEVSASSTDELEIHPKSARFDEFELVIAKPVMLSESGKKTVQLVSAEPIHTRIIELQEQEQPLLRSRTQLPEQMTVTTEGEEEVMHISMAPGGIYDVTSTQDMASLRDFALNFAQLKITGMQETFLTVDAVAVQAINRPKPNGNADVSIKADIKNLMTTQEDMAYGALSVGVDMAYDGPLPQPQQQIDWASTPSTLNIQTLLLSVDDASASLTGKFETGSGELLPVGQATLRVQHFDFIRAELLKHQALDAQSEKVVDILLQKITGTAARDISDLDVVIAREKGGSLKFGKLSFEEALAIVLTGGKLSGGAPSNVPAQKTME